MDLSSGPLTGWIIEYALARGRSPRRWRPEQQVSRSRAIRVLLVAAATSTTGGGERHVADLMHLLPARGVEVGLVTPAGGDLSMLSAQCGIPFHHAEIAGGFSLAALSQLRAALKTFEPDIVHAHGTRAAFHARLADSEAASRVVYTLHGIHVQRSGSAPRRALALATERWLRSRTAGFVTVCESDARKGGRLGIVRSEDTVVVHNGIEESVSDAAGGRVVRSEAGVDDRAPLVLSVGRFVDPKDQKTLLAAWSDVVRVVPAAVLVLVGSGPLEGELRAAVSSQGVGDSVRFLAPRPDLRPAYSAADVFALSSLWEGLPYVILEAMAHGLPVVSTNVDGIPEAVEDGVSGLLVPPRDPAALADAIVRLLGDPAMRARMGEAGQRIVRERFGLERMADELVAVYRDVAGRG